MWCRLVRLGKRVSEWMLCLVHENRGGVIVLLVVAAAPLVMVMGIGVDTARGYMVRSRLSSALDAAGLAGGRVFFLPTRDADIRMYFDANFPPGFMDATVNGPNIVADPDNEHLFLNASATVPTTFMRLGGIDTITVYAEAEIERQMTALDIVLAIDVSGSMGSSAAGGGTRIAAARTAANELINILFGSSETKERLKIGLVPWNAKVRITIDGTAFDSGATTTSAVSAFVNPVTSAAQSEVYYANNSPVPLLSPPPSSWKGCVFNRYIFDGVTDNDADVLEVPTSVGGKDWPAWEPIGPEGEPVDGYAKCSMAIDGNECTPCPNYGITPLQNSKTAITTAVNALLTPNGNTNIPGGLGWAWRVLTHAAPFTEADAEDPEIRRTHAIVLLTDGENYGGSGDGYKGVFGVGTVAQTGMNARLRDLAANIKKNDIVIYTIQFANAGGTLQALMKEVASGPEAPYYYYAPDADALTQVFREVANHVAELRLSR